jgi:hypothetical protein
MSRHPHRCALAATLLVACAPVAWAEPLPRVFFSPAERTAITAQRHSGRPFEVPPPSSPPQRDAAAPGATATPGGTAAMAAVQSPSAPVVARARRIDGITVGRDARPVAWIGGERIVDGANWGAYRIRVERDGVRLVAGDGSVRRVRVGMELPP